MDGYSPAIDALSCPPEPDVNRVEVTPLAVWFLPNFPAVIFAVTLLQVLFLSAGSPRLFHDSDTGWHIRNGEAILAAGEVPEVDTFSYTRQGQTWFAWEWLSDVAFGAAHRAAGLSGVALLAAAAIALTACGAAYLAISLGGNLFYTAVGIVLLLGVTSMHWLARPHVFSWILALVFLGIAERERRERTWMLWLLPGVAALWANVHASFLLGPAILFIYALGEWLGSLSNKFPSLKRRRGGEFARPKFLLVGTASLLATCINPYAWRLHQHVFAYLQSDYLMDHIEEFRSFNFHSSGSLYVELFLAVAVLGTIALFRQRAFGPAFLSLAMLHLALYSARHLPTAAVLVLPLSILALTRETKRWPYLANFFAYSERLRTIDKRIYGLVPVALMLVLAFFGIKALAAAGRVDFDPATFPVQAANFLENNNPAGEENAHVFATDQWGGYLIYRFNGRLKVFIDGRSDFYGREVLENYGRTISVKPGWDKVLKQYDVRRVLVPADSTMASVLQLSPDWKCAYTDQVAVVYERVG